LTLHAKPSKTRIAALALHAEATLTDVPALALEAASPFTFVIIDAGSRGLEKIFEGIDVVQLVSGDPFTYASVSVHRNIEQAPSLQ